MSAAAPTLRPAAPPWARGRDAAPPPPRSAAAAAGAPARLGPLVWLFLAAIVLPVTVDLGSLALSGLRILCLLAVLPLLAGLLSGRHGRVIAADWLALAHVAWMALSLALSEGAAAVQLAGSMGVEFLGGYLIARVHVRDLAAFRRLCAALTLVLLALLPVALVEARTGVPVIPSAIERIPGVGSAGDVDAQMRLGLHRVQAVFVHPIHFGLFAAVAFALCWTALQDRVPAVPRALAAGAIALSGFLSLSSGGILAVALQVALIAWAAALPARIPRWWILAALFALAYAVVDLLSNRTPLHVFLSYATFSAHTAYWRLLILEWGLVNVAAHPWFGIGMADWMRPAWMHSDSVDNFWLIAAMRHGVPGFVTLAGCWLAVLVPVMRRPFAAEGALGTARRAWVFSIVGLIFTLFTVHAWGSVYSFVMFLLGSGAWMLHAEEGAPRGAAAAPPSRARPHSRFPAPAAAP
ncbi:O-antigen ligase [Jannaschia sp. W003]|uniref:O-antigen ligase family protein n=1 Tax=Jannaschia sp. W003 TaxID=2867012 RepID=UPI0021A80FC7|nr:O-antigen ligase family protein [Jannaschia sp. W003]UWQ21853.1 O-antigen ligase family protein [Jannaschia sp. W003]